MDPASDDEFLDLLARALDEQEVSPDSLLNPPGDGFSESLSDLEIQTKTALIHAPEPPASPAEPEFSWADYCLEFLGTFCKWFVISFLFFFALDQMGHKEDK